MHAAITVGHNCLGEQSQRVKGKVIITEYYPGILIITETARKN